MKPTFGKATSTSTTVSEPVQQKPKVQRKEKIVIWIKHTDDGEEYLSVKINDVNGAAIHLRAYKKKDKKTSIMPDYVGYERLDNASTN